MGHKKEVVHKPNTIAEENLPFPIVLYPGFYGTFFGFRSTDDSPITLCSCAEKAVRNYLRFRGSQRFRTVPKGYMLDYGGFPHLLVDRLVTDDVPQTCEIIDWLIFKKNLCHECNGAVPKYRYCVEMYGSVFKQNFGWYINKQAFELGIQPVCNRILPETCPKEIQELLRFDKQEAVERYRELAKKDWEEAYRQNKERAKQERRAWNIIENIVRDKFGYRKIGEEWTSESILYKIVRSVYPEMTVLRHYRPDYLQGLEMDIYIQELRVGIEYQGLQHFQPVEYFGGPEAFQEQKERDRKKSEICNKAGVSTDDISL